MKPIIDYIPIFDKNFGTNGSFITNSYITGYKIEIKDTSNVSVYIDTVNESSNKFTIPADTDLVNGENYILTITTYEENGKEYTSDPVIIKCCTTPEFELSVYSGADYFLKSTILNTTVTYSQSEDEELNYYYVVVKDKNDKTIFTSDYIYNIQEYAEINDLNDNSIYYVTAYGKTINGMDIQSKTVKVITMFSKNELPMTLKGENNYKNASIDLGISVRNMLYRLEKAEKYTNVYDRGIDLSDNTLEYYDGFSIDDDFSMAIEYTPTSSKGTVLLLNNNEVKLFFKTLNNSPYFEFYIKEKMLVIDRDENDVKFSLISNFTDHHYRIAFRRINGNFDIKIKEIS